jgi:hypothetical protein
VLLLLLLLVLLLQVAAYHKLFTDKYMKLGATSVEFTHQYTPNADAAAHVIVVGTPKNVFLVFRCGAGQLRGAKLILLQQLLSIEAVTT